MNFPERMLKYEDLYTYFSNENYLKNDKNLRKDLDNLANFYSNLLNYKNCNIA